MLYINHELQKQEIGKENNKTIPNLIDEGIVWKC